MTVSPSEQGTLPGVITIRPAVYSDDRGYFMENWQQARYREAGPPERFVQDNVSFSKRGVLRGLHFQHPAAQGKLVTVLRGEIFDVVVDVRYGSPTFGKSTAYVLSQEDHQQLYVPPDFAHGFLVTSDEALVTYKCTDYYQPRCEQTLLWNDATLAISWPTTTPILSEKDRRGRRLVDFESSELPAFSAHASGSVV